MLYQIGALERLAVVEGTAVRYVKPHGALYNAIVHHERQAAAVVEALVVHAGGLPLMGLPGGVVERLAGERGVAFVAEGFAGSRASTADGRLVPRAEPGALLTTPDEVAAQACRLADGGVRSTACTATPRARPGARSGRARAAPAGVRCCDRW